MDWVDLADAAVLFARVGLPAPGRAPLMPLDHQVAQKLHALTGPGDRARDLVDLQLIAANAEQASGLPVLQNLADAVEWANGFIRLIAVAG